MRLSTAVLKSAVRSLCNAGWIACLTWSPVGFAQTWTTLATPPDSNLYAAEAMLLTDGTVMVQSFPGRDWWRLTPDQSGSYINGTWSRRASLPAGYAPDYFASAVLADGRMVVIGGEHNSAVDNGVGAGLDTSLGAIYDPLTDAWTPLQSPAESARIGD